MFISDTYVRISMRGSAPKVIVKKENKVKKVEKVFEPRKGKVDIKW